MLKSNKNNHQQQEAIDDSLEEEAEGVSISYIIFTVIIGLLLLLNWLGIFPTFLGINTAILLTLIGGYKIFWGAIESLFKRKISVDLAIALAAIAALSIKQYLAAAEVIFIMLIGEALESFAVDRTRGAIKKLINLSPKKARVIRKGQELEIDIDQLIKGDRVVVKPGERIPVDGQVLSGHSSVDQSTITGESIPVEKSKGAEVFTGTINQLGMLDVRADKVGKDTLLSKIIHLVEEAQSEKAPIQKIADKYAKYFVPAVILISGLSLLITRDLVRSVSILIIACPCALVLARPTAIFAGIGRMAKEGILVKGGTYLEQLGRVDLIAFDKTGTLTQGKPKIAEIITFNNYTEEAVLALAAAGEQNSEHLLATIVVEEAQKRAIAFGQADEFLVKPGLGIEAKYKKKDLFIGNRRLLEEKGINFDPSVQKSLDGINETGQTPIFIASGRQIAGIITVQDEIRPEAAKTIEKLKKIGIKKLTLLTGDNEKVAKQVARQVGIEEINANLLPDGKVRKIKEWQNNGFTVAMIGDGINDAPSLTSADVGIAMGGIGSDIAIETANVIFMADDLSRLVESITIGKKTVKIIKQNILNFGIIFNTLAIIAATSISWVTPVIAAIIHQISSLMVVGNSLRLLAGKMRVIVSDWAKAIGNGVVGLGRNHLNPFWVAHSNFMAKACLAILLIVYCASGITVVSTDQVGVVQRFGKKIVDRLQPGMHLYYPWPIDKITKVQRGLERVEIGFRKIKNLQNKIDQTTGQPVTAYEWELQHRTGEYLLMEDESLVFTGDENFLEMDMVVQYYVKDPSAFLFKIRGFEDTADLVRFFAQSSIREILGQKGTDKILTVDRSEIEKQVVHQLQKELESLGTGISVKGAYLQSVHPPIEVADAFRAVVNAHEEKSMLINLAEAYHNEQIPLAHGKGTQTIKEAESYQVEKLNKAKGEGTRFLEMCEFYKSYPEITSQRLYLEMVEQVLPDMKKFILDAKRNGREELTIFDSKKIKTVIGDIAQEFFSRGRKTNQ